MLGIACEFLPEYNSLVPEGQCFHPQREYTTPPVDPPDSPLGPGGPARPGFPGFPRKGAIDKLSINNKLHTIIILTHH